MNILWNLALGILTFIGMIFGIALIGVVCHFTFSIAGKVIDWIDKRLD